MHPWHRRSYMVLYLRLHTSHQPHQPLQLFQRYICLSKHGKCQWQWHAPHLSITIDAQWIPLGKCSHKHHIWGNSLFPAAYLMVQALGESGILQTSMELSGTRNMCLEIPRKCYLGSLQECRQCRWHLADSASFAVVDIQLFGFIRRKFSSSCYFIFVGTLVHLICVYL